MRRNYHNFSDSSHYAQRILFTVQDIARLERVIAIIEAPYHVKEF